MTYANEATRKRYRAKGQCWYCPKKAARGKSLCSKHLKAHRETQAQRYWVGKKKP